LIARACFYLSALVMAGSLLLGGATRAGFLSDAILQLLAIPLLLVAAWRLLDVPHARHSRWAAWFCLALVLTPILQLIPLPPALWTALPNKGPSSEVFALIGHGLPWMPISVSPHATWLSALSLVPPIAIFLAMLQLGYRERRMLSLLALAVGIVSVFIGLIQVAQGPSSPLRFFGDNNSIEAVGFFANRNHFAALLYCLMLLATAWAAESAITFRLTSERTRYDSVSIVALVAAFTVLVVLLAAQAMARSRAGLGLSIVALLGAFALAMSDPRSTSSDRRRISDRGSASGFTTTKLMVAAIALAVMFAVQFALYRILERFTSDPLEDTRLAFARNSIEAAVAFMPFGSGLGTFVPIYAMFEKTADALANRYANHAHNDVLELWLDTGAIGLAFMGMFAAWLVPRTITVWRRALPSGARGIDRSLARAATIALTLLIVHSFVDYPLRTGAMMAIMAFVCGLLFEPPVSVESGQTVEPQQGLRHRASARGGRRGEAALPSQVATAMHPSTPPASRSQVSSAASPEWRRADIEWPEAWRESAQSPSPATTGKAPSPPKTRAD
jgi:O-antigen ligase